jgi:hypothetical protein
METMETQTPYWMLTRMNDGLVKKSKDIMWIEWDDNGKFKAKHEHIAIGRSLIMSPFNQFFTWQTTTVTQITAATPDSEYIEFNTENSTYRLTKIHYND